MSWESAGAGGGPSTPGQNAYTVTSADFVQPAVGDPVVVAVVSSAWAALGQMVFAQTGGQYLVAAKPDGTHAELVNIGGDANAAPGATIPAGSAVSPSGFNGEDGVNAYATTLADFVQPNVGAQVVVEAGPSVLWAGIGQTIACENGGVYQVASVPDPTHVELTNISISQNAPSGSVIPAGSKLSPSGPPGILNGTAAVLCKAATDWTLPACTYSNGTGGIGATLTANANGALPAQDGVALLSGDVLFVVWRGAQNGPYVLTQGDAGTPWVLTRYELADTANELAGLRVDVANGDTYAGWSFILCLTSLVVGTTPLEFNRVSGPRFFQKLTAGDFTFRVPYTVVSISGKIATGAGGGGGGGGGGAGRTAATAGGGGGGKSGAAGGPCAVRPWGPCPVTPGELLSGHVGDGGPGGKGGAGGATPGADGSNGTAGTAGETSYLHHEDGTVIVNAGRGTGPAGGGGGGGGQGGKGATSAAGGAGGSGGVTSGTPWPESGAFTVASGTATNGAAGGTGTGGLAGGSVSGVATQPGEFYSAQPMIAAPNTGTGGAGDGANLGGGGGGAPGANGGGGWEEQIGGTLPSVTAGKGGAGGIGGAHTNNAGGTTGGSGVDGTHGRAGGSGAGGGGGGASTTSGQPGFAGGDGAKGGPGAQLISF